MTPAADVTIDSRLVQRLLSEQTPEFAAMPIRRLSNGWDNELFRIGDQYIGRFPRRSVSADLVEIEQRWLPQLAPLLPLPIPTPVVVGTSNHEYPYRWSIIPWVEGESLLDAAERFTASDYVALAESLGSFVSTLHSLDAPEDGPRNSFRGIPLAERTSILHGRLEKLRGHIDSDQVLDAWVQALAVPSHVGDSRWVQGDLHPGNLIVRNNALVSVIDYGDLCVGDPASDFACAWMIFDAQSRSFFRRASRADDDLWNRGRGWALAMGVTLMADTAADAPLYAVGQRALTEALGEL